MKRNKIKYEQRKGKYFYKVVDGVRTRISKVDYNRAVGQTAKLITKKGKVLNQKLLSRLEKKYGKAEVSVVLKDIMNTPGEKTTYKHIKAKLASTNLEKMFINIGRSPEELAAELGTTVANVENPDNWKNGVYVDPDLGKTYELDWNYEGNVFKEITADE